MEIIKKGSIPIQKITCICGCEFIINHKDVRRNSDIDISRNPPVIVTDYYVECPTCSRYISLGLHPLIMQ